MSDVLKSCGKEYHEAKQNMMKCLSDVVLIMCLMSVTMGTYGKACPSDSCNRQEFREMTDQVPTNPVVLIQRGPWPWKNCRRLCRQYFECLAFQIEWSDTELGLCTIYKGMIKRADLVAGEGRSTYISCPGDLVWDEARDVCHSPVLQSPLYTHDAEKICRAIYDYPDVAHPTMMTPRSPADSAWLHMFASGINLRIGIYRPPGGGMNDFRYLTDDTAITWSNWKLSQPDMSPAGADYVAVFDAGGQGHTWFDAPDSKMRFICEI